MRRGQAFDAFKLLIAAVVAGAILVILLAIINSVSPIFPDTNFDLTKASITDVQVYPRTGTAGTVFNTLATVKIMDGKTPRCVQPPMIAAVVDGTEVQMYDDGKHGDRKARDCVFGGVWPSGDVGNHSMVLRIEDSQGLQKEGDAVPFTVDDNACVTLVDNGPADDKLDIVFVADGYGATPEFASDVKIHSEYLLSIAPFSEYTSRINVHRVHKSTDLSCSVEDGIISCDDSAVYGLASECPGHDEIIVLLPITQQAGTANPHAYVANLYPEIMVHEFGHSFGPEPVNLVDEYSYGISEAAQDLGFGDPPNCAPAGCAKWSGLSGIACESQDKFGRTGCTYTEWYRPVKFDRNTGVSVMEGASMPRRSALDGTTQLSPIGFNEPSKQHLIALLEGYT